MIKLIIKLALVALVANATWRVGNAYVSFYKFRDSVSESAQFSRGASDDQLHARIMELAAQFDVPVGDDDFTIRRDHDHTFIDGTYTQPIEVVPGYKYPWSFSWNVDAYTVVAPRIDLNNPQPE